MQTLSFCLEMKESQEINQKSLLASEISPIEYSAGDFFQQLCRYCYMDALHGR